MCTIFLCGKDKVSGHSYEHRRGWLEERLLFLGSVFAIDIATYAAMSNHTHEVVCANKTLAESWSMLKLLSRWHMPFQGTLLTQKYQTGDTLSNGHHL